MSLGGSVARGVLLTVTGPMGLTIVLSRDNLAAGNLAAPASQKLRVADGMADAAEPATHRANHWWLKIAIPD